MDAHFKRHQPLITARLIFTPKSLLPPLIITAWMEFPLFSIPQHCEWSPPPREHSLTPEGHTTLNHLRRYRTPQRDATPIRKQLERNSMTFETNMDVDHDSDTATTPKKCSTPRISQGISVTLKDDGDVESPLTSLSDEDGELESEEDGEVNSTKIPKPPGAAGHPQSGGYDLQEKLGWNDKTYESVIVSMSKVYIKDSDQKL